MKVAIVTLVGDFNYGNRLQNYALQEVLKSLGVEVLTVDNPSISITQCLRERLVERVNGKRQLKSFGDLRREKSLRNFTRQYIHMAKADITSYDFDYFVVGSDQVWNPSFWEKNTECYSAQRYLLENVEASKRVSYAASFGIDKLNDFWVKVFQKELSVFHAISVREVSGAKIVDDLCGKKAEVVLDPTLVLSKEKWNQMAVDVQEDPYILAFFLGEIAQQKYEYIDEISRKNGYKIINMSDKKNCYYGCSPEKFLGLIKSAKLVLTDSFHATVFSLIFHTPFLHLTREQNNYCKMSGRLETLLSMVDMTNRFDNVKLDNPFSCEFDNVDLVIDEKRKKSVYFLRNALGYE